MSEIVFPVLGAAFVLLVVLPGCALVAKLALLWLERSGGALHDLNLRYAVLTASSILPLGWFLSAGIHQAETGKSALACVLSHDQAELCFESASFALLLVLGAALACVTAYRRASRVPISTSPIADQLAERIERIVAAHPALLGLRDRIAITEAHGFALGTRGLRRPRVIVGAKFATQLTDGMLASALGHEQEHVRSRDPLRYLLLQLALSVSPLGRLVLGPHAAAWRAAREARCDREAVLGGAAPLPLADAIVRAARPMARESVALGATDTAVLRLRVDMLLAFAERAPERCRSESRSAIPLALALLVVTLCLPHRTGTQALDALHTSTERALSSLLR